MADVFVSYSQIDRSKVDIIANMLMNLYVDCWFDHSIMSGQNFATIIRRQLEAAKVVVVCWSPNAIQSDWVDSEADYARQQSKLVPIFIAPCVLMPPFTRLHADDLSSWTGAPDDPTWLKFLDAIGRLLDRPGLKEAAQACASPDQAIRYAFAQRYPDDPFARQVWQDAEKRYRNDFQAGLVRAEALVTARIRSERERLLVVKDGIPAVFEAWLVQERRGAANVPVPDPEEIITNEQTDSQRISENAALNRALAAANAKTTELSVKLARNGFKDRPRYSKAQLISAVGLICVIGIAIGATVAATYYGMGSQPSSTWQAVLTSATAEIKALREKLADAEKQQGDLKHQLEIANLQVDSWTATADRAMAASSELSKTVYSQRASLKQSADKIDELTKSLSTVSTEATDAETHLRDSLNHEASLKTELDTLNTQSQVYWRALNAVNAKFEQANRENEALRVAISHGGEQFDKERKRVADSLDRENQVRQQLTDANAKIIEIKTNLISTTAIYLTLKNSSDSLKARLDRESQKLTEATAEITELKTSLASASDDSASLTKVTESQQAQIEFYKKKLALLAASIPANPGNASSATVTEANENRRAVSADQLTLRQGPDSKSDAILVINRGALVTVKTSYSNGWAMVEVKDRSTQNRGYVNAKYLTADFNDLPQPFILTEPWHQLTPTYCTNPGAIIEHVICTDSEMMQADTSMLASYDALAGRLVNLATLKQSQTEWLKSREASCSLPVQWKPYVTAKTLPESTMLCLRSMTETRKQLLRAGIY